MWTGVGLNWWSWGTIPSVPPPADTGIRQVGDIDIYMLLLAAEIGINYVSI